MKCQILFIRKNKISSVFRLVNLPIAWLALTYMQFYRIPTLNTLMGPSRTAHTVK